MSYYFQGQHPANTVFVRTLISVPGLPNDARLGVRLHKVSFGWLARPLGCLLLVIQLPTTASAQTPPNALSITQVPPDGFLLKDGWRFQAGDIPNGASPMLDDSHWRIIDPTKEIRDLPLLQQAGSGWLRLHLRTGPDLPPLMIKAYQSVASEIYLDGRLLYCFGTVSTHPDRAQAYDPRAAFSLPLNNSSDHVLALRIACQPGPYYTIEFLHWYTVAIEYWLFSSSAIPTFKPYDVQEIYFSTFKLGIAFILFILHLSLFFCVPGPTDEPLRSKHVFAVVHYLFGQGV